MITVTRAEWNARPPLYANALTLSQVTLFIVHYSGASRSQTVRSIQDYCMDVKGASDIDYNAIVKDGKHFVGRGWNKGGHTLNHNSISYGVCVVGQDGDATAEDMNCVREIYEMVCAQLGRRITVTDHRNLLGASYTDCPGDELDAWVDAGMPAALIGDDMDQREHLAYPTPNAPERKLGEGWTDLFNVRDWEIGAGELVPGSAPGEFPRKGSPAWNLAHLPELLEQHAAAPIDPVALRAVLADAMQPALEALEARLEAKFRDAVADLGEGGSTAVRADQE